MYANDFNIFKTEYLSWLNQNLELASFDNNTARLTAPFLDFNNDHLEIYIIKNDDHYILTDFGETISNLEMSSFHFKENGNRSKILNSLITSYGMKFDNSDIYTECTISDFSIKANALMQCMIKVSDMLLLSENNIKTIFSEDVKSFFDKNDIRYTPNISIMGKSELYTNYDFVIPRSSFAPERFITPINILNETLVKSTIFSWEDVKAKRENGILYTFINDIERTPSRENLSALKAYGIKPKLWSKRENYIKEFVA